MDDLLIRRELIRFHSRQTSVEGIFREAYETLLEKGYVRETYLEALLVREAAHPTALALENINIAIPHADPAHVEKGGIMVRILTRKYPDARILAIDADPAVGLATALGVTVESTMDDIRKAIVENVQKGQKKEAVERIRGCETEDELYEVLAELMGE